MAILAGTPSPIVGEGGIKVTKNRKDFIYNVTCNNFMCLIRTSLAMAKQSMDTYISYKCLVNSFETNIKQKVTLLTAIKKWKGRSIGLFCQITGQRPCCFVLYNHLFWITSYFITKYGWNFIMYPHHTAFLLSSCYPGITWLLADDIF